MTQEQIEQAIIDYFRELPQGPEFTCNAKDLAAHIAALTAPSGEDVVYVPCEENDPRRVGGFTSDDGRSLFYVRESSIQPTAPSAGVWVKASDRLPDNADSEKLYVCKVKVLGNGMMHDDLKYLKREWIKSTGQMQQCEWLDESRSASQPGKPSKQDVTVLLNALRDIDLMADVADPPYTPKMLPEIARKAFTYFLDKHPNYTL